MSNQPQTTPTFAPWLPAPAPRIVVPTTAPPNPWVRIANETNPPPKKRQRRLPIGKILMALLLIGGASAATKYILTSAESRQRFTVETEAFTFILPDTPTTEPILQAIAGLQITGTNWTVDSGNVHLIVTAMNFGFPLDETTQQVVFDEGIAGGANAVSGTVTSDTWSITNGVYERETIVATPHEMVHIKSFGKGAWGVFVFGPTVGSEAPSGLNDVVNSFRFV